MRLRIVGQHPRAHGSECVIFGSVSVAGHLFAPMGAPLRATEVSSSSGWDVRPMRPVPGAETAPALVGVDARGDCRTTGRLIVLSHSWSGALQINNLDRRYTVDLYSEVTRLVLLDLVAEIVVDVSSLARCETGAIRLPALTRDTIMNAIVDQGAWFTFLSPDADFKPGPLRRALGWRPPRTEAFKLQILSRLLPALTSRPAPPTPSAHSASRDEMRLLAAAVEGLALRTRLEA